MSRYLNFRPARPRRVLRIIVDAVALGLVFLLLIAVYGVLG